MLRADGESDGTGTDSLVRQFPGGELGMGGRGRVDHQALHVGHVGQQRKDF